MSAVQVSHFGVSVSVTQIGPSQSEFLFLRNFSELLVSIKRNFGKPETDCPLHFVIELFLIFRNMLDWAPARGWTFARETRDRLVECATRHERRAMLRRGH